MTAYTPPAGGTVTAPLTLTATDPAAVPLTAQGAAAQTANLQEWKDAAGSLKGRISPTGSLIAGGFVQGGTGSFVGDGGDQPNVLTAASRATAKQLIVRGATSQTASLQEWQNSAGTVVASVKSAGFITAPSFSPSGNQDRGLRPGTNGDDARISGFAYTEIFNWNGSAYVEVAKFSAAGLGIGATADPANGKSVLAVKNAITVPTTNPTAGGIMYAEAGALKWRGSSGTVTTIAPA